MCIRATLSAIAGAVVVFVWTGISWTVLPWHNWGMKTFKNEGQAIEAALKVEAPESGIYILPTITFEKNSTPEAQEAWFKKAQHGPFAYMSVSSKGLKWDMKTTLVIQFFTQLVVAIGMVCLLAYSTLSSAFCRAIFISLAATLGTVLMNISGWNWWAFPLTAILVNIADVAIGWLLGGFIIGLIAKKPAASR